MHVQRFLCGTPQSSDYWWTHSNVRYKSTIHHIDMDPICARTVHGLYLVLQATEVRSENGWSDANIGRAFRHLAKSSAATPHLSTGERA